MTTERKTSAIDVRCYRPTFNVQELPIFENKYGFNNLKSDFTYGWCYHQSHKNIKIFGSVHNIDQKKITASIKP